MKIRFQIMGRRYDAATGLPDCLNLPDGSSVAQALEAISDLLPAGQQLPESCLVVLAGEHLGTVARFDEATLSEDAEILLIAPVAGG